MGIGVYLGFIVGFICVNSFIIPILFLYTFKNEFLICNFSFYE